jgi:hypothetical protein
MPHFAHISLILAPDRSKLSKRHGATSVGQVKVHPSFPGYIVLKVLFGLTFFYFLFNLRVNVSLYKIHNFSNLVLI